MQASVMLLPYSSGLSGDQVLAAFDEVRLDHDADDALVAGGDLAGDVASPPRSALELLAAVGVREIDHHRAAGRRRRFPSGAASTCAAS
jgi:hypothetical protein